MPENLYHDTRGRCAQGLPFTEAVVKGLAPGGGLFVPDHVPSMTLDEILALADAPYADQAAQVYRAFDVDLPDDIISALMRDTYGSRFDTDEICPVTKLTADTFMLELWHGPTSAFKDMALQCLPRFFTASAKALRERGSLTHNFLILVATSGDTGKAALEGFRDLPGVSIGVMYPDGGVSDIQRKQMVTQRGDNVRVWGVRGNFDDCQTGAKTVFSDEAFAARLLSERNVALSSANSINWGRLMPQIVYYLSAYARLAKSGAIAAGDPIDVCVPTGNFGNILAAWYAKKIGAPIETLLCASNENRVLTDFINTGTYDIVDREFVLTPSPSMDILVSSNLERQLFELTDRNGEKISGWMDDLKNNKTFRIDKDTFARLRADFRADSVDSNACLTTIREVFERHDYLIDPHTAVAYRAAENLRAGNPVLIASTAHWAKFGSTVYRALHGIAPEEELPADVAALSGCKLNEVVARETGKTDIPQGLAELDDLPVRFTDSISGSSNAIEEAVLEFLGRN